KISAPFPQKDKVRSRSSSRIPPIHPPGDRGRSHPPASPADRCSESQKAFSSPNFGDAHVFLPGVVIWPLLNRPRNDNNPPGGGPLFGFRLAGPSSCPLHLPRA